MAEAPTLENCGVAEGCGYISVFTQPVSAELLDRFKEMGIRMVSTRSMGFDHIDMKHAEEIGMAIGHITYDPSGVAEFTVMDILMAVRRVKELNARTMSGDFRLNGMLARQLRGLTVGIIGTGQIGMSVLRDLSGFGCKLCYYNRSENPEADRYATRVTLNELLSTCDVVSLHIQYNANTHHFIDADAIARMKDGAILVNTSRGGLVDTEALIAALESGHLASAALDVVENEFDLFYFDCRDKDLSKYYVGKLRGMPNVIYSHHMAYYYREAVWGMVYNSIASMKQFDEGMDVPLRLI